MAAAAAACTAIALCALPSGLAHAGTPSTERAATATPTVVPFSASETIERTNLVDNQVQVVDHRTFSVNVSQTVALRDRQEVTVSWSGAHPTGGLISQENLAIGAQQEYPVVLMECRGTAAEITPETCWTQTSGERVQTSGYSFPPWRIDQYASETDRGELVGAPTPYPLKQCANASGGFIQYWVPFVGADGTIYQNGPNGCDGIAPDQVNVQNPSLPPSNTTYAQTDLQGSGTDNFVISTDESNASLGCSSSVACSLVIIPIEGLSCDPSGEALPSSDTADIPPADVQAQAAAQCESPGNYQAGEEAPGADNLEALTDSGLLWWSASNWRNRVAVPLHFAPPSNICSLQSNGLPVDIYGSELMAQATTQWEPAFCLNPKSFTFNHVLTGEPEAKNLLRLDSVLAAFQAAPPSTPFSSPVVQAPVGLSGFAISYVIDNGDGTPYLSLKLDARLLAKLLTESYPGDPTIAADDIASGQAEQAAAATAQAAAATAQQAAQAAQAAAATAQAAGNAAQAVADTNEASSETALAASETALAASDNAQGAAEVALGQNPTALFDDPEFQALNPGFSLPDQVYSDAAATLFQVAEQSDVMSALTSYINSDPDARAWLNGQADPWGMVVNPAYKGIKLPVSEWPLLDQVQTGPSYTGSSVNLCLQASPAPIRPLLDTPEPSFADVVENMQYAIAPSTLNCNVNAGNIGNVLAAYGAEREGSRFILGLVPIAAADEYDLSMAALETGVSPSAPAKFTSAAGRTFASVTPASLEAAAKLLQPDTDAGSWTLPYGDFQTDAAAAGAYPGTMLLSLDVPSRGLAKTDATDLSDLLSFADSSGQVQGFGNGQLPPGYLPLTAANGLGNEVTYTQAAAADVLAQNGQIPPLVPGKKTATTTTTIARTTTTTVERNTNGGSGSRGNTEPVTTTTVPRSSTSSKTSTPVSLPGGVTPADFEPATAEPTLAVGAGLGGLAFPLALLAAIVALAVFGLVRLRKPGAPS